MFLFQVEEETVMRVDLENRLQSLKEELAFKKSLYDEVGTKPFRIEPYLTLEPNLTLDPNLH